MTFKECVEILYSLVDHEGNRCQMVSDEVQMVVSQYHEQIQNEID